MYIGVLTRLCKEKSTNPEEAAKNEFLSGLFGWWLDRAVSP